MKDWCASAVTVLLACAVAAAGDPAERPSAEENILRDACVKPTGDGLTAFFRGRTLSDAETKRIYDLIQRLGANDFDAREGAAEALKKVGGRAVPLLRAAAQDPDPEVARRVNGLLKETEPLPPLTAVAAARLLARRGAAGAVPALLDYLPFAADGAVEDEVRAALAALTPAGKPDPALAAALDDPQPVKRAAAAYVLARKGDKEQREAVRKRLADKDAQVRWQAAAGLLAAHDRAAVPALVDLLGDGPLDPAWRAEEALRRLAGDAAPDIWLSDAAEARAKCRDAWAAWWKDKGEGVDVGRYEEPPRPLGYTLAVEYNTGRVWECDLDGSLRWEIRDLAGPMDAQVLPNGHVLIAEADAHRVTERDFKGAVVWQKKIGGEPNKRYDVEPNGCRRLGNGNTFITCPARAMEVTPDGAITYLFKIETGGEGSNAIRKARGGTICYTAGTDICEVDTSGKHIRGDIRLPAAEIQYVDIEDLPGDRFLVADSRGGHVLEVNGAGVIQWEADVAGACGAGRLQNGHTLVGCNHRVVELSEDGKPVWETAAVGFVRRVYRR